MSCKKFCSTAMREKKDGFFKDTSHHLTRKTKTVLNIVTLHLITDFFWRVMKWTSIVALKRFFSATFMKFKFENREIESQE